MLVIGQVLHFSNINSFYILHNLTEWAHSLLLAADRWRNWGINKVSTLPNISIKWVLELEFEHEMSALYIMLFPMIIALPRLHTMKSLTNISFSWFIHIPWSNYFLCQKVLHVHTQMTSTSLLYPWKWVQKTFPNLSSRLRGLWRSSQSLSQAKGRLGIESQGKGWPQESHWIIWTGGCQQPLNSGSGNISTWVLIFWLWVWGWCCSMGRKKTRKEINDASFPRGLMGKVSAWKTLSCVWCNPDELLLLRRCRQPIFTDYFISTGPGRRTGLPACPQVRSLG